MTDPIPDVIAESADNVAYGAATQAVVAAARAWRAKGWGLPPFDLYMRERNLIDAIDSLDALEARLRDVGPRSGPECRAREARKTP